MSIPSCVQVVTAAAHLLCPAQPLRHLLPFAPGEYNRLARLLREKQKEPADFIGDDAAATLELAAAVFGRSRLESLLGHGFLLSQAVDRYGIQMRHAIPACLKNSAGP